MESMDLGPNHDPSASESDYTDVDDLQEYEIPDVDPNNEKLKAKITRQFHNVGRLVKEKYYMERIKDFKVDEDGKPAYLIRWTHWPSGFNSWVKEREISHALEFIHDFFQQHPNKLTLRRQLKPDIDKKLAEFKKKSNRKRGKKSTVGPSAKKPRVTKLRTDTDTNASLISERSNPSPSTSSRGHHVNSRLEGLKTGRGKPRYFTFGSKPKNFTKTNSSSEEEAEEEEEEEEEEEDHGTNPLSLTSSDGHDVNSTLKNPETFGAKCRYFTTNSSASSSSEEEESSSEEEEEPPTPEVLVPPEVQTPTPTLQLLTLEQPAAFLTPTTSEEPAATAIKLEPPTADSEPSTSEPEPMSMVNL